MTPFIRLGDMNEELLDVANQPTGCAALTKLGISKAIIKAISEAINNSFFILA